MWSGMVWLCTANPHLTAGGRGVVMARFEVPEGWTAQAYRFALDPTPAQERALRSHADAGTATTQGEAA